MQIYYESLQAIAQTTQQLDRVRCVHCNRAHQLVSHGFVYKKRRGAPPLAVGKRAFCSNRNSRVGCGRTTQLYLDETIRYLHYAGSVVVAFIVFLMAGESIAHAYAYATSATNPRHVYRWLNGLGAQLSTYRCLLHQPPLSNHADHANEANAPNGAQSALWETRSASSEPSWVNTALDKPSTRKPSTQKPVRLQLLFATIKVLIAHCGLPLCNTYQQRWQRPFFNAVTAVYLNIITRTQL